MLWFLKSIHFFTRCSCFWSIYIYIPIACLHFIVIKPLSSNLSNVFRISFCSTLPFLFCEITGSCKYASRNDFVYWLSGDIRNTPMTPVANAVIEPYVSRCTVCKTPDLSITVHSQDTVEPVCPSGYDSLWDGYSFLMVRSLFWFILIYWLRISSFVKKRCS